MYRVWAGSITLRTIVQNDQIANRSEERLEIWDSLACGIHDRMIVLYLVCLMVSVAEPLLAGCMKRGMPLERLLSIAE
jgi:hypothetical protein